ncbi:unnamed protein product [Amoebophrya sp. A25]|nr:unnamed protein product [Amoebophrya sp. A25]|eukprot:GSA25T00020642001.1
MSFFSRSRSPVPLLSSSSHEELVHDENVFVGVSTGLQTEDDDLLSHLPSGYFSTRTGVPRGGEVQPLRYPGGGPPTSGLEEALQTGQLLLNLTLLRPVLMAAECTKLAAQVRQEVEYIRREMNQNQGRPFVMVATYSSPPASTSQAGFASTFGDMLTAVREEVGLVREAESDREFVERRAHELRQKLDMHATDLRERAQDAFRQVQETISSKRGANRLLFSSEDEVSRNQGNEPEEPFLGGSLFPGGMSGGGGSSSSSSSNFTPTTEEALQNAIYSVVGANALFFACWRGASSRLLGPHVRMRMEDFCSRHFLCSNRHLSTLPQALYTPLTASLSHQRGMHFLFNVGALWMLSNLLCSDLRVFDSVARGVNQGEFDRRRRRRTKEDVSAGDNLFDAFPSPLAFPNYPTTAASEYLKFTLATGALSIVAHCASGAKRAVMGASGTLMSMMTLAALVDPTRQMIMFFPIPGLQLSMSQISDVNILVNSVMALAGFVAMRGRRPGGGLLSSFSRAGNFNSWNYRTSQRQGLGQQGGLSSSTPSSPSSESSVAWTSHMAGIALGFAYYWYGKNRLGLWKHSPDVSHTHSWPYTSREWNRTYAQIEDFRDGIAGRRDPLPFYNSRTTTSESFYYSAGAGAPYVVERRTSFFSF